MIIGGVAVIAHGVPRVTRDVDATIAGGDTNLDDFLAVAARHAIEPRIPDAREFAKKNYVLLLRHVPSRVDVDLSFAWMPFELEALAAAQTVKLHGAQVRLVRPEDLVVYKVIAWRPQDRQDVERLLALHGSRMDLERVKRLVAEISQVLETPERSDEFLRLLQLVT